MVQILLNGDRRELPAPLTVRALLESLSIDARVVAVEVNRAVVRRHDHEKTWVTDGAEVEIVSFVGGGAMCTLRRRSWLALLLAIGVSSASYSARVGAQSQPPQTQTPVLTEDTLVIYNGWAMLASGDLTKAASYAQAILNKYPNSIAGASLSVEVEIVRGGGEAGLGAYERWLGSRRLEDGYLLRRAAHAILWDLAKTPEVGVEALQFLAADGDLEARNRLVLAMNTAGSAADTRALARIGDEGAIRRLIDQVEKLPSGNKMFHIQALVDSRSPLVIPTLTKLLSDKNYPQHIAAAAEGLGSLGAKATIPTLRQLYQDTKNTFLVRQMAAVGLYKMNDMTGLSLLQTQLALAEAPVIQVNFARFMAPLPGGPPPDPNWLKVVRGLTSNKDAAVRAQAAGILAPYDLDQARRTIEPLLIESDPAVREIAAQTMLDSIATDFSTIRRMLRATSSLTRVRAADRVLKLTR